MGQRVTTGARMLRMAGKCLFHPEDITAEDAAARAYETGMPLWGPFPLGAAQELLLRVKEIVATYEATSADPEIEISGADTYVSDAGDSESQRVAYAVTAVRDWGAPDGVCWGATFSKPATSTDFNLFYGDHTEGYETAPLYYDEEEDAYWVSVDPTLFLNDVEDPLVVDLYDNGGTEFEGTLVLAAGEYTFPFWAFGWDTFTLELAANTWHPYATRDGSAAWDVASGAPANDGPAG
jgi:hypothetical protein